jgi:hypothetical protein
MLLSLLVGRFLKIHYLSLAFIELEGYARQQFYVAKTHLSGYF